MKIIVTVNNKPVEIELTDEQVKFVKTKSTKITERLKTFSDILSELGIDEDSFYESCEDFDSDEIAYRKIKLITKAFNEGWIPDYSNSSQYKYYPYFLFDKGVSGFGFIDSYYVCVSAVTGSGARLVYKSRELSDYAGKQFAKEYNDYLK